MPNDPSLEFLAQHAMVGRIATLSRSGRPSVTSLYFVPMKGHVWLGTSEWTLAARHVQTNPHVALLLNDERNPHDQRVLRIKGQAMVRTDAAALRAYNARVALKYMLSPDGIRHMLAHIPLHSLMRRYHAQSAEKGRACIIDVTPEQTELLNAPLR